MSKGIYIASKVEHGWRWRKLRDEEGVPIISTWIDECGSLGSTSVSSMSGSRMSMADAWSRNIEEASHCAVLIVYCAGEFEPMKGALVELGAALAHNVPVFWVRHIPSMQTVANHPGIKFFHEMAEALEAAREEGAYDD
jgi:hypothetical protein